jgi:tetratricopeptide (TPR) repeat protein
LVAAACALSLLAGCAENAAPVTARTGSHHVSPPAVPAPTVPGGSFDRDRAQALLAAARADKDEADRQKRRDDAQAAVDAWPGDADAWQELADACRAMGDPAAAQRADYFHGKVAFANTLPTRAAVLGFQTIAQEIPATAKDAEARRAAATRLWAFFDVQDKQRSLRTTPEDPSFAEEYPYGTMLLSGGVIAGILTVAKSLANK